MSNRLNGIRNRELWALSPSEQARVVAHATRAGVQLGRGKSVGKADRAMTQVWEQAEQRVVAEEAAKEKAAIKKRQAKADAKAERKAKGWW
ncbi:MAG: hypothetical protein JO362_12390 [Streptomycetaceae bacterium]|nr:hypothetical protein [Streptomycetaceae bacterium]